MRAQGRSRAGAGTNAAGGEPCRCRPAPESSMSGGVLVTGGAGFVGSHLVDGLVQAGERVTVLDDFSSGEHGNLSHHPASRVRVITGSILDDASIEEALADCDRVYH